MIGSQVYVGGCAVADGKAQRIVGQERNRNDGNFVRRIMSCTGILMGGDRIIDSINRITGIHQCLVNECGWDGGII